MSNFEGDSVVAKLQSITLQLQKIQREIHLFVENHRPDLDLFSPSGFPLLPRGGNIGFGDEGTGAAYLASGWWPQESWGVWGKGVAELRFHPIDYVGGYLECRLTIRSMVDGNQNRSAVPPAVSIVANGFFVGRYDLSGLEQVIQIRLPASSVGQDGDMLLQITHTDPISPKALLNMDDDRELGIALIGFELL